MDLLLDIAIVAAYGTALVAAYRRWRWLGPIGIAVAATVGLLAWGTLDWRRPHTDLVQLPPFNDWQCHSIILLPSLLFITLIAMVALRLVRPLPQLWRTQLAAVFVGLAVGFLPAAFLALYMGVGLLACDTL
jgi:hypothetical protein